MRKAWRLLRWYLVVAGILAHALVFWLGFGGPVFLDRWLVVSERPVEAGAIVCLAGGLSGNNLPTESGMQRIYTAVQLYLDGYAPRVIFSGGGSGGISQSEVYAEVAGWLGLPREAAVVDPFPGSTAEHPWNVLKIKEPPIRRDTVLLVATSPLHSRRAALCFRKAGFSRFRMVTHYTARRKGKAADRLAKTSRVKEYVPSGKRYGDFLFRLRVRSGYFLEALRETAAICWYRLKGKA